MKKAYNKQLNSALAHQEFALAIDEFATHMGNANLPWMVRNNRFTPGMARAFERYLEACKRLNDLL